MTARPWIDRVRIPDGRTGIVIRHLWSLHGTDGCTARIYPASSLEGEPCPCEYSGPGVRA
jgi:hypothetical protein